MGVNGKTANFNDKVTSSVANSAPDVRAAIYAKEETEARKYPWFYIKFFNDSRYVFVDSNYYGLVWPNVILFVSLHLFYLYGMYILVNTIDLAGWTFCYLYIEIAGLGISCGAHRLWTHRAYKAKLPLRIFLCMCHTMAGQNDLYTWVRDHRLHHKFSETDADPHNSMRGMFFAHVGWLLTKKHPDVIIKGKTIDMSDIDKDPVVTFQRKFYVPLYLFFRFFVPIYLPMKFLGSKFSHSFVGLFATYLMSLHVTWFVNSAAHWIGDRPYNNKIQPRNNIFLSYITLGEGFHNYHHTFPWDYTIGEDVWAYNKGMKFIEIMEKLGLAYDLKRATPEQVERRMAAAKKSQEQSEFYGDDHPYISPHEF